MYPVDMHTHTSHYSSCGHQTIEELVRAAHARGLQAVCVTEHHFRWPDHDLAEIARRLGLSDSLTVLGGEEISAIASDGTRQGDYLVFGIAETLGPGDIRDIIRRVHDQGGIVIAAHPMRHGYNSDKIVYELDLDAIEVYNKNHGPREQNMAWQCVEATGVLAVGCSDAHRAEHVGMYLTYFSRPVFSVADLIDQVKTRRVRPQLAHTAQTAAGQ